MAHGGIDKKSERHFSIFKYLLSAKCHLKGQGGVDKKGAKHFSRCTSIMAIRSMYSGSIQSGISMYMLWGQPERRQRCEGWWPEVSGLQVNQLKTRRSQGFASLRVANQHAANGSW